MTDAVLTPRQVLTLTGELLRDARREYSTGIERVENDLHVRITESETRNDSGLSEAYGVFDRARIDSMEKLEEIEKRFEKFRSRYADDAAAFAVSLEKRFDEIFADQGKFKDIFARLDGARVDSTAKFEEIERRFEDFRGRYADDAAALSASLEERFGAVSADREKFKDIFVRLDGIERIEALAKFDEIERRIRELHEQYTVDVAGITIEAEERFKEISEEGKNIAKDISVRLDGIERNGNARRDELDASLNASLNSFIDRLRDQDIGLRKEVDELRGTHEALIRQTRDETEIELDKIPGRMQGLEKKLEKMIDDELVTIDAAFTDIQAGFRESIDALTSRLDDANEERQSDIDALRTSLGVLDDLTSTTRERLSTVAEQLRVGLEETGKTVFELEQADGRRSADIADLGGRIEVLARERRDWHDLHCFAEDWARGGPPYREGATVRWRGGLWQATKRTDKEPTFDVEDWVLLVDGVRTLATTPDGPSAFRIRLEQASGQVHESDPVTIPRQTPRGLWKADTEYAWRDLVLHRGSSYEALRDSPAGVPHESEDWALVVKRGARGSRGPQGEPGEVPPIEDFLKAWSAHLEVEGGVPIMRYRGAWRYQESYRRGDVVAFETSLRIALEDNDGSTPPSGTPSNPSNTDWIILFNQFQRGLTKVEGDPNPVLGGDLVTNGKQIQVTTDDKVPKGMIGDGAGVDGSFVYYAYTGATREYETGDGALLMRAGHVGVHGASLYLEAFDKPGSGSKQLYVTDDGLVYGVDPPAPGWRETDTDTGDYDLGSGTGTGPWVQMTGLGITIPQDVADGNRVDVFANIDAQNKSGTWGGSMDVGFGINGAQPTSYQNYAIAGGFDGFVAVNLTTTTHGGLTTGDTVSVWCRRTGGVFGPFGIDLTGSTGDPHELTVTVPPQ